MTHIPFGNNCNWPQASQSIMKSIQLILFDLDGLLVDTEEFHFHAYQAACERFGYSLPWDFHEYLLLSGASATAFQDRLRQEVPGLFLQCSWEDLYNEKKIYLKKLLFSRPIPLMPGTRACIEKFCQEKKPMAVVTNSSQVFTDMVIRAYPFFSNISCWIFREKYTEPKPSPEGYILACTEMGVAPQDAIGFEDSLRGIEALIRAGCIPVLVNAANAEFQDACREKNVIVIPSLEVISL